MNNTRETGRFYELQAQKYFKKKKYKIIDKNFLCKFGEIDIVAAKDDVLVFVEVKARKNTKYGYPREFVTLSKQRKIIKTAEYYLMKNNCYDIQCRFDVLEIIIEDDIINHIENAFWIE